MYPPACMFFSALKFGSNNEIIYSSGSSIIEFFPASCSCISRWTFTFFDFSSLSAEVTSPTTNPINIPLSIEVPIWGVDEDAGCTLSNAPDCP